MVDVQGEGEGPAYRRLAMQIRTAIMDGRITTDTRLPSERALADATGLSRTTTTRAYEQVRAEGLAETRRGSGTVVRLPLDVARATSMLARHSDPDGISLTTAATEAPPALAALIESAMRSLPTLLSTDGYLPDGLPALRDRLARRYTDEGLPTDPEQIIVTSGAQSALTLLATVLIRPGDRVLVEGCGYPHAYDVLGRAGARLLPLPLSPHPWPVDDVARLAPAASLALLVPDFHNPTGASMTSDERRAIAHTLRSARVTTIVDETMRDVRFGPAGHPEHYTQHDPASIVVGSAGKALWGGLRIGWIRAPHALVPRLVQSRMTQDLGTAALDQIIVATALQQRAYDDPQRCADLAQRRDVLLAALADHLPDWRTTRPVGGLSVWATLPRPLSSALTVAAEAEGVALTPGPRFFASLPSAGEHHLRLPFVLAPERLREAVRRLARAWDHVTAATSPATCDPEAINLIA